MIVVRTRFFPWDKCVYYNPSICTDPWYKVSSRAAYATLEFNSTWSLQKPLCREGLEHGSAEAGYLGWQKPGWPWWW